MRLLGCALIQYDWWSYIKRRLEHRQVRIEKKPYKDPGRRWPSLTGMGNVLDLKVPASRPERRPFCCLSLSVSGPLLCQPWADKYISWGAGCRVATWRTRKQKWAWRIEICGWGLCFLAKSKRYSLTQMKQLISDPFGPVKVAIPYRSNQYEQRALGKSVAACHIVEW